MTEYLFTWIDMNEPSVFSGPELTLPKDSLHAGGALEHRDIHNLFGYYQSAATSQVKRPFTLHEIFDVPDSAAQRFSILLAGPTARARTSRRPSVASGPHQ